MAVAKLVFTMVCFCVCANAQTGALAVYPRHAEALGSIANHSLDLELKRLLSPAGIDLVWLHESKVGEDQDQVDRLIVGTFEGNCSVETIPSDRSTGSRTLAETSLSDGRILPYFTVDCAHIIRTLAPTLQPLSLPFRYALFGRAVARVIAHEIYHILADTADHDEVGVAKAQLSFKELTAARFDLSPASLHRIQSSHLYEPAVNPTAGRTAPGLEKRQAAFALPSVAVFPPK